MLKVDFSQFSRLFGILVHCVSLSQKWSCRPALSEPKTKVKASQTTRGDKNHFRQKRGQKKFTQTPHTIFSALLQEIRFVTFLLSFSKVVTLWVTLQHI